MIHVRLKMASYLEPNKMTIQQLNTEIIHPSWQPYVERAMQTMDPDYLFGLASQPNWLPGPAKIFSAFTIPISQVNYVLFGESPYPRAHSANGYAFWDAAVTNLWSPQGLSKPVNRATSLRNIIKMLLIAEGLLSKEDTSQPAIAAIDKNNLIKHNDELFHNLLNHGFLLLNTSPVLSEQAPKLDARAWMPFMKEVLVQLLKDRPQTTFILLGRIATEITPLLPDQTIATLQAEHPYNLSFIKNQDVIDFFRPFHLLCSNPDRHHHQSQ